GATPTILSRSTDRPLRASMRIDQSRSIVADEPDFPGPAAATPFISDPDCFVFPFGRGSISRVSTGEEALNHAYPTPGSRLGTRAPIGSFQRPSNDLSSNRAALRRRRVETGMGGWKGLPIRFQPG